MNGAKMSGFLALTLAANTAVVSSLDMESALHPQTILAVDFEHAPLTPQWRAPRRLRIPTKLGFKSTKSLQSIEVINRYPGGFRETRDTTGSPGRNQDGSMPRFPRWLSRSGEPVPSRLSLAEPARV
jgi:DMSO/TMAO reductase YedYZ molybdopterin-dependent catalytic subunit